MSNQKGRQFWNRFAERYAARAIKDVAAYEALIATTAAALKLHDHVLELGCGTGGAAIRLAPSVARLTATDFSEEMIRIAQEKPAPQNVTFGVVDAEHAFAHAPFDAVLAFNLLHLVADMPSLLRQIHTHLRPHGLLICKTWCFAELGLPFRLLFLALGAFGFFPPAIRLTKAQLRQSLKDAGFVIVDERILGKYPQNPYIIAQKP